jgi:hypothetical protein
MIAFVLRACFGWLNYSLVRSHQNYRRAMPYQLPGNLQAGGFALLF